MGCCAATTAGAPHTFKGVYANQQYASLGPLAPGWNHPRVSRKTASLPAKHTVPLLFDDRDYETLAKVEKRPRFYA